MRRHGYLFEQIATFDNLLLAAQKALRGKKDRLPVAEFYFHLETDRPTWRPIARQPQQHPWRAPVEDKVNEKCRVKNEK